MNTETIPRDRSALRILELGDNMTFALGKPGQTDFYMASMRGNRSKSAGPWPEMTLARLWKLFARARRGDYDLVVVQPPIYPWWHLRSFLTVVKNTLLRGRVLGFFATWSATLAFPLLRFLPRNVPMVVVDMNDSFGIFRHNVFLFDRCHTYFKRELPIDKWHVFYRSGHRNLPTANFRAKPRWRWRMNKIAPLGVGTVQPVLDRALASFGNEKKTDLFFAGTTFATNRVREEGVALLDRLKARGVVVDHVTEILPFGDFIDRCAQAWLTWSPAGFGWECFRHLESSLAGSVPVISSPTIHRYQPMNHGEHCFFYHVEGEDLVETVIEALKDKDKLARMAEAARDHVLQHHTHEALCDHVIDVALGDTVTPKANAETAR
ncbi:MAG: glycosyltransferase [Pseudomonadota bacterium]